jgi:ABC-type microcin C transport system permease subunit YejB
MSLQELSLVEGTAAVLLSVAGFAIGYATPLGGIIVVLLLVLFAIDVFFDSAGAGLSGLVASGLGKLASLAWSPVDAKTSSSLRLWAWRAPGLATLVGFLVAWAQSYAAGGA